MTEESAVKVCVRVRPLIKREEATVENAEEPTQLYWKADKQVIHQTDDDGNLTKSFGFDRVFSADETTSQLYQDIAKPLVVSAVEGYNGTIFAYGQTSSGKTFTMMGSDLTPGVIPLAMTDVFQTINNCPKKEFLLRVSYMEIYNETVTDLLCDSWKRKPLEIREGNYKNVYVADLTEELVTSPEQALAWIRKGEKNRHYGKTKMNQRSSRSHTIFRMILESRERSDPVSGENADGAIIVSHLNLVDLAGAERASQTGAEGTRFKEGCNINRSLFTLGQVIKKLSDESQKGFTNYRDSKLTRILQNSLGGNAKTVIICTITPATVDETLSTLQFASAAKRMKNDPHVTEVSDDGALLRRYRNEIVDLKRRLHEVSSVTQTTVTEKETLFQLLQEKDQLQREQSDRIRNLTKLLVTASNVVQVQKHPKRRVTWGGKLLRSAQLREEEHGSADLSFAEPFFKKRRADMTVNEEVEDMDDFDRCFYSTTEDTSIEMEMCQNVTMRSSGEGVSSDSAQLMFRIECLERQLETETREKQNAEAKALELEQKMDELKKRSQSLQEQLEEKCSSLELKVTELERPSHQDKVNTACEAYLGETIQLCETLSFEKESIATECDMLKQTLELLTEDMERLKQDNEALLKDKDTLREDKQSLLKDIEERKDADEFEQLEEESKRDYEKELEDKISELTMASAKAEELIQNLKADLELASEQLKKKDTLLSELQTMNGKDLMQEVTQLRRSLDDAEGLSLQTKKEWAFLRSENLALKERDATLTAEYNRMESEVKGLQTQLENEKSRFKRMQTDLQKELLGAFDENTKITALLDGKVPKNVMDNITLEKTVAELRKELEKSQGNERLLKSKADEMKALQDLPARLDDLFTQVCDLTGELNAVREERNTLLSAQVISTEEHQRLQQASEKAQEDFVKMAADLSNAELREDLLTRQHKDVTDQLRKVQMDLERISQENDNLHSALAEANQKSLQLGEELESLRREDGRVSEETEDGENSPEGLQGLRLVVERLNKERDELQEILQSCTEERDQLKRDMEDNVEMMIENQEELRTALEKVRVQQDRILHLEERNTQLQSTHSHSDGTCHSLTEDLHTQVKQLKQELQSVCAERDVLSEKTPSHPEEMERMRASVDALAEERDQLQEMLRSLREERTQLQAEMKDKDELITCFQTERHPVSSCSSGEEESLLQQIQDLRKETEELIQENSQLRKELEGMSEKVAELTEALCALRDEKAHLLTTHSALNEEGARLQEEVEKAREEHVRMESELVDSQLKEAQLGLQQTETSEQLAKARADVERLSVENDRLLSSLDEVNLKAAQLGEELESLRCEREKLLSKKVEEAPKCPEEVDVLCATVNSLTEERDQLQEILQALRTEHRQLKRELDESNDMLVQVQDELKQKELHTDEGATGPQDEMVQQLQERLEALTEKNQQMKTDLQENVEMMIENQAELRGALENVKELQEKIRDLELQRVQLESNLSHSGNEEYVLLEDLKNQIRQLNEELQAVYDEKNALLSERAENGLKASELERAQVTITSITEERDQLLEILHGLREERNQLKTDVEEKDVLVLQLREELRAASAERDQLLSSSAKDGMEDGALERVQATLGALGEERDQLLEILQGLREDKNKMRRDLEDRDETIMQLRDELLSTTAQKDHQLAENSKFVLDYEAELETCNMTIKSLTQERDQIREENEQMKMDLWEEREKMSQLREELKSTAADNDRIQSEKTKDDLANMATIEQLQVDLASVTEDRDQLLDTLQGLREEMNQLKKELEEKEAMITRLREEVLGALAEKDRLLESVQANFASLTEERDQLLNVLQELKQNNNQLKTDLDKKDETLKQLMELQVAQTDHVLRKDASCSISNSSALSDFNDKGNHLQELLQGVRQLIQAQSEMKHHKPHGSERSVGEMQEAQLQQMQALGEEIESLRNERTVLRKDLHEAAEMSKTYQKLLHSTKEELKQSGKENADLVAQSAETRAQLQEQLSQLNEELLSLRGSRDQLGTELQTLQSCFSSLEEENEKLHDMLECARAERHQLTEELECLGSVRDQLQDEKTNSEQLLEALKGVREERDQLRRELDDKMEESLHEVNPTVTNVNEQTTVASNQRALKVVSEIESLNEKLKSAFMKLQSIIDHPSLKDHLGDDGHISNEQTFFCQLFPHVSKSHRSALDELSTKTIQLKYMLAKTAMALKRSAQRYKTHFMLQVQRDVASFEERRFQDVLIRRTQAPLTPLQILREDLQEVWDQRLLDLLEKRQQNLQDMNSVLVVLEDWVAKHAVTLSEDRQARARAADEARALARTADTTAILQFVQRELVRRTALTEHQTAACQLLLDQHDSAFSLLRASSAQLEQRFREEQRETLALLPANGTDRPKTEADLLLEKQRLCLQLQQTQKQMEVIQQKMEVLKVQADETSQKHLEKLQELHSNLKEKEILIENLQEKLKKSEALAKTKMPPSAAEMEAIKDKLVKMELDHIAVTTAHEKEIAQLNSMLEHREDAIRKLKDTLRKAQQEDENSFVEGEEACSKAGTQTKALACVKEKKIEELHKKNAHFESLVTKQQEEITKWKNRAYKLRGSRKEAPQAPHTPTKRQPPLVESEVNSPKKAFLDSPKSKFFDIHTGGEPMSLKCPKQFFDNSNLGTMPEASTSTAVSASESDQWWRMASSSPRKPNTNMDANGCPTQ
ncbi:centromere-associated protein E isoform X2 [Brachyhypopomus gauderio]|uniref:centromere-associated protein E isoform X2 n=1 Tax=Brachyhypopomus gauderio TaxID=698409 RepID=UPI004041E398